MTPSPCNYHTITKPAAHNHHTVITSTSHRHHTTKVRAHAPAPMIRIKLARLPPLQLSALPVKIALLKQINRASILLSYYT
jgi:hypothetical protein